MFKKKNIFFSLCYVLWMLGSLCYGLIYFVFYSDVVVILFELILMFILLNYFNSRLIIVIKKIGYFFIKYIWGYKIED